MNISYLKLPCLFAIFSLFAFNNLYAQKFYGTTSQGGEYGIGAIISYDISNNTLTDNPEYSFFTPYPGERNRSKLIEYQGILYGTTIAGGKSNEGVLFSYEPVSQTYKKLFDFNWLSSGAFPAFGLTLYNGKLYGTTSNGGITGAGTLFSFEISTGTFKKLFDFGQSALGQSPTSLTSHGNKLYGITQGGGANNNGVLFSFEPASSNLEKLIDFNRTTVGSAPLKAPIYYNGKLYGATRFGGVNDAGTIYSYDLEESTFQKLFDFEGDDEGADPVSGFLLYNRILYGTMSAGGTGNAGVLFSFDPSSNLYQKLFDFEWNTSGVRPTSDLVAKDGNLYGTTDSGGQNFGGTIFSYEFDNETFQKLFDFKKETSGSLPLGGLTLYNSIFYGSTAAIDFSSGGSLYSFDSENTVFQSLLNFNEAPLGGFRETSSSGTPIYELIQYKNLLYGTSSDGGVNGNGTIFSYSPEGLIHQKVFDFKWHTSGAAPFAGLTLHEGILYGTTSDGGMYGGGTLFSFNPVNGTFQKRFDFLSNIGDSPFTKLISHNGKLYGTTEEGGMHDGGTLFVFDPVSNIHQKLFDFDRNAFGDYSVAALTLYNNKLYGTTVWGGIKNDGTLFCFDLESNVYQKLFDFDVSVSGSRPFSPLTFFDGLFYGTTFWGGPTNSGTLFSFDPDNNTFQQLLRFNTTSSGFGPFSTLTPYQGKLYGTTRGNSIHNGTLYSFDPFDKNITKITDFDNSKGVYPPNALTIYGLSDSLSLIEENMIETSVSLQWNHGSRGLAVSGYEVFRLQGADSVSLGVTTERSFRVEGLNACTNYTFLVKVNYSFGLSSWSNTLKITTPDGTSPVVPASLDMEVAACSPAISAPVAIDNCDGPVTGTTGDRTTFEKSGEYEITWVFKDATGNNTQAVQTISVVNDVPTWYVDADNDGYGNPDISQEACEQPEGYVANNTDCDDTDDTVYPSATELHDGKDNDCDGQIEVYTLSVEIGLPDNRQNTPLQVEFYTADNSIELFEAKTLSTDFVRLEGLLSGSYIIKVVPDNSNAPELLTTYSGDVLLLSEAAVITLDKDMTYRINIRAMEQQSQGKGIIEGFTILQEGNTDGRLT